MTALMHFLKRADLSIEVHTRLLLEEKNIYLDEKLGNDFELPHNITNRACCVLLKSSWDNS